MSIGIRHTKGILPTLNYSGRAAGFVTGCVFLAGVTLGPQVRGAEPESIVGTNSVAAESSSTQEALRAYLQLQEQLHATQLAIERGRKEAELSAAESALMLSRRLQAIESRLQDQRERELASLQNSNRAMLLLAGGFAVMGFLALISVVYLQWRAIGRLAEISTGAPAFRALGAGMWPGALPPPEAAAERPGAADLANERLLGALDGLERRIRDLEKTTQPSLGLGGGNGSEANAANTQSATPSGHEASADLLARGQELLEAEDPDAALTCFEEALQSHPEQAHALVKKGTALERLRRLDEALDCYDRAIRADGSLTIAYLQKGGLFNRMERFAEALQCYELALHSQERRKA